MPPPKVPGRLITGQRVDERWQKRAERLTAQQLSFFLLNDPEVPTPDGKDANPDPDLYLDTSNAETLSAWVRIPDIQNRPGWVLRVDKTRTTPLRERHFIASSSIGLLFSGGVTAVLLLLAAKKYVVSPVSQLLHAVHRLEAGQRVQVIHPSHDELGEFVEAFNRMSGRLMDQKAIVEETLAHHRLILDSIDEALMVCNLEGNLVGPPSEMAIRWFGPVADGTQVATWLFTDFLNRKNFRTALESLQADLIASDTVLSQFPSTLRFGNDQFRLKVSPIRKNQRITHLLLVLRNIKDQVDAERILKEAIELKQVVRNIFRAPVEYQRFVEEIDNLLQSLQEEVHQQQPQNRRLLMSIHTIKSLTTNLGFTEIPEFCQSLEQLGPQAGQPDWVTRITTLQGMWDEAQTRMRPFLPDAQESSIQIPTQEYQRFLRLLKDDRIQRHEMSSWAESWTLQPIAASLRMVALQAPRLAEQLHRSVTIEIDGGHIRADSRALRPFLTTLPHVIKNSIIHGIEDPDVRVRMGKRRAGHIRMHVAIEGNTLLIEVSDDGAGIDWTAIRERALVNNLPTTTQLDLIDALFSGQVSTTPAGQELAGKGVGLAAVRESAWALGGDVQVISNINEGTRFLFRFPIRIGPLAERVHRPPRLLTAA